ncbi:MAG: hypothetical protein KatS3mg031_1425 [Chitinophagales bacterium]|nr:MAG: hypothetical protein KatS3mg031_1425 [Chitinophagales bacterium]
MIVSLEKQFNALETQRKKLLSRIAGFSHEQQNYRPAPQAWSMLQVLNHLIYAEANTVKYLDKKILAVNSIPKSGAGSRIRLFILNSALRSPFRFKAPKAALPHQEEVYIFENLRAEWDQVRQQMHAFLNHLDAASARKLIFRHPIAGRFNIHQTLSFIEEHIRHHEKQIDRIAASSGFPTGNTR